MLQCSNAIQIVWAFGCIPNTDISIEQFTTRTPCQNICTNSQTRAVSPLGTNNATHPTHSANSSVFGTVALSRIMLTCCGSMINTSSQTTPRWNQHNYYM